MTDYRLSVKGWLCTQLPTIEEGEQLYERLNLFVAERAKSDGYIIGVPTLIFKDGGICVTIPEEN